MNYNDNGLSLFEKTITLYGNYKINGVTLAGYVSQSDGQDLLGEDFDTAYGLGASYDLGGATLAGAVQSNFGGDISADLGVKMSF